MNRELFERDRILDAFEAEEGEWLEKIRAVARALYAEGGKPISADEIREAIELRPALAPDRSMNVMGSVFRSGFRRVGWRNSRTPGSHGNRIGTYIPETEGDVS